MHKNTHINTKWKEIISLVPWLAGELVIFCPQSAGSYLTCHTLQGRKRGWSWLRHTRTSTHIQSTHSNPRGALFSGYRRFAYMVHTSSLAFDLRKINETNFLWMQHRITANMKAERERTETRGK